MLTETSKWHRVFTAISLSAFVIVFSHTQTHADEIEHPRERLAELQLATRQIANLHGLIKRSQIEKFQSSSLETESLHVLEAHCLFEEAVHDMLENNEPDALMKIGQAIALVVATAQSDTPSLRRLVLAREALVQSAQVNEFRSRIAIISDTVQKHSIPTTEARLVNQYDGEQWFTSAETILRALDTMESVQRRPHALSEIVNKAGAEILAERTLVSALTGNADSSVMQHEVLLDRLVFQNRRKAMFDRLFSSIAEKVKMLPNALQPPAFALFTLWCGQSPEKSSLITLEDKFLSPEEIADYFMYLDSLMSIAQKSGLEKIRVKMTQAIPASALERCPAGQAGLNLADALIDAKEIDRAMNLVKRMLAQNSGIAPQTSVLEIKCKVSSAQWTDAVQAGEASLQIHGREALPPEAFYWMAQAQVKAGQGAQAIENFKEFVQQSPGSRLAPTAALMAGLLNLNLQNLDEAKLALELTIKTYPNSPAAEKARSFLAISARQGDPVLKDPKDMR